MDGIREWGTVLCCTAVGCCILQILIPKKGIGKLFHLLLFTFLLCSMISPLLNLSSNLALDIDFLNDDTISDALTEKVNEQLQEQIQATVADIAKECLAARKVKATKIEVITATAENGALYIRQVIIEVTKQEYNAALVVREVLENQLNTDVFIVQNE